MRNQNADQTNCPTLIAHAGGKGNWPENTMYAINNSISLGIPMVEFDVQISIEGIPVLYHPTDLSELTDGSGSVSNATLEYLKSLDAAYYFNPSENYPLRGKGITIPTLNETLEQNINTTFIIDMKSLPAKNLVDALIKSIPENQYHRLIFYSTNNKHLKYLLESKPDAITFESRTSTKQRLLDFFNTQVCDIHSKAHWIGFELSRTMSVVESLTLGTENNTVEFKLWSSDSVSCVQEQAKNASLVGFGVNNRTDYNYARDIKLAAVYTDYPKEFVKFPCTKLANQHGHSSSDKPSFYQETGGIVLFSSLGLICFLALCYMMKSCNKRNQEQSNENSYCLFSKRTTLATSNDASSEDSLLKSMP